MRLGRHSQSQILFANQPFRSHQTLRNRTWIREEYAGDLLRTESSNQLEAERYLRIRSELWLAAHEDHPQFIVTQTLLSIEIQYGLCPGFKRSNQRIGLASENG